MLEVLWELKSQLQLISLLLIVILALWRGAAPERLVAGVFIGMYGLDRLYHLIFPAGLYFFRAEVGHVVIDVIVLVAFTKIALRVNRFYPLWLTGCQLITLVSHTVQAVSPSILTGAYAILAFTPSYLQVLGFGVGVVMHLRRQAHHGQYPSFRSS
jgi:hypothetical protein